MHEAFTYCWTDRATNMLYPGSHKGTESDGYVCSSEYMMEEYEKRPEDFSRQIIAHGTYAEMRRFEAAILKAADAAHDPMFYNRHNGDGEYYCKGHLEKTKKILAEQKLGKPCAEVTKVKISARLSGRKNGPHSEERKERIRVGNAGKKDTDATKQRKSEASPSVRPWRKGLHWWTNGSVNRLSRECPSDGFVRGQTREIINNN